MTLKNGALNLGEIQIQNWNILETAIGYDFVLIFQTDIRRSPPENHFVQFDHVHIEVASYQNKRQKLGIGAFDNPMVIVRSSPGTTSAHLPLSPDDLQRLEEYRNSENLKFFVSAFSLGYDGSQWARAELHADYEVSRSAWIDRLSALGSLHTALYEIPITSPHNDGALDQPIRNLRQAQRHLADGNWNSAVKDCRSIILSCGFHLFGTENWSSGLFKNFENKTTSEATSQNDRERAIWWACLHYTNLANHEEDAPDFNASYSEAKMMIILASTMIYRARKRIE